MFFPKLYYSILQGSEICVRNHKQAPIQQMFSFDNNFCTSGIKLSIATPRYLTWWRSYEVHIMKERTIKCRV